MSYCAIVWRRFISTVQVPSFSARVTSWLVLWTIIRRALYP
jgi:hypothetical protein